MNKKIVILALTGIIVLFIGGDYFFSDKRGMPVPNEPAQQTQQVTYAYKNITSLQLNQMLMSKDFFFVNVHIPYEGEIASTDAFIPYDRIQENLSKFPQDKKAKIVLYCRSGMMSEVASQRLNELGYINIYNLKGGMNDWEKQGYLLIKN